MTELTYIEKQVLKEYTAGTSTIKIRRKLNITYKQYIDSFHKLKDLKLIKPRGWKGGKPKQQRKITNICKNNGYFNIIKNNTYYACTKNYSDAIKIRDKLKECNWDKTQVKKIKQEVMQNAK